MPNKKTLKPPYYELLAICHIHGMVTVQRKPNPKAGQRHPNGCGGVVSPYPGSTVCPHPDCGYHCLVVTAQLVHNLEAVYGK